MRKLLALLALSLAANMAVAQDAPLLYRQTAKWVIGGEGGWDDLAIDKAGNRLFVAHGSLFEAIDLATGKKVGEIPASGAHGVAIDADHHLGFGTNGRTGSVTAFDLATLKPVEEIKTGEGPDAIVYDPHSGAILVMNSRSQTIAVIDPATRKVTATIPAGGKLEAAVADASHLYVNIEDRGEIAVVDTHSWKIVRRWPLAGCEEPSGLAIDEQSGRLFSVCGNAKMIVVDTATGRQISSLPTGKGTDGAACDPAQHLAFASNGEGTLTIVRAGSDGQYLVAGNVATARGARTMVLDPSTHNIYLATADFGPSTEGQRRPPIKPGSFAILVYSPVK